MVKAPHSFVSLISKDTIGDTKRDYCLYRGRILSALKNKGVNIEGQLFCIDVECCLN